MGWALAVGQTSAPDVPRGAFRNTGEPNPRDTRSTRHGPDAAPKNGKGNNGNGNDNACHGTGAKENPERYIQCLKAALGRGWWLLHRLYRSTTKSSSRYKRHPPARRTNRKRRARACRHHGGRSRATEVGRGSRSRRAAEYAPIIR